MHGLSGLLSGIMVLAAVAPSARAATTAAAASTGPQLTRPSRSIVGRKAYFTIRVIDGQTGRGIPLVRLQTVNGIRRYTDSNGEAVFFEPGLMHAPVFFFVHSPGYRYPKDGFGFRGVALMIRPGGRAVLRMQRTDIAERLYRVTGGGIYRASVLAGVPAPLKHPLLDGDVFGSDGVMNAVYRGRIYWFWGDTLEPQYPLGNFSVTGATSLLPGQGGLNPLIGVNLHYFCDKQRRPRAMAPIPGSGPTWISGLTVLRNHGRESLYAMYGKYRASFYAYRRGLLKFDNRTRQFKLVVDFPSNWPMLQDGSAPLGHSFIIKRQGRRWIYFANPLPLIRVPATAGALADRSDYQAFTCLKTGSDGAHPQFDRSAAGALRWGWRKNTAECEPETYAGWKSRGLVESGPYFAPLRDVENRKPVLLHAGSVQWNAYLQRWLLIAESSSAAPMRWRTKIIAGQRWVRIKGVRWHIQRISGHRWIRLPASGSAGSMGDIFVAAGDTPLGPWGYAQRVVHFPRMSFYNPNQDWFFDRGNGREVFFEATYSRTFSPSRTPTPRYDYNQLMYKLDLDDPRLLLPTAFYGTPPWTSAVALRSARQLQAVRYGRRIAFFALVRPRPGTVPVYVGTFPEGIRRLTLHASGENEMPLFYAYPRQGRHPPGMICLWQRSQPNGQYRYAALPMPPVSKHGRPAKSLCLVWPAEWRKPLPFAVGNPSENH